MEMWLLVFVEFKNFKAPIESRSNQINNKINSGTIYKMLTKWIKTYLLLKI